MTSAASAAISGLAVHLVDKNIGEEDVVAASGTTGAGGLYSLSVVVGPPTLAARLKPAPDLQTQIVSTGANGAATVLAVSAVAIAAKSPLSLDIALPAGTPGFLLEYETLTTTLAGIYSGRLKDLKENNANFRTLPISARGPAGTRARSPWPRSPTILDPRGCARHTLPPRHPMPLPLPSRLRACGPNSTMPCSAPARPPTPRPFQVDPATVSAIWTLASEQNVIPASLGLSSIPQALETFQALAPAAILTMTPKIGVSTLHDLVVTTLSGAGQPEQFAALLVAHADDWTGLWADVGKTSGAPTQAKLQLLGQLSYLTLDNAPLLGALHHRPRPRRRSPRRLIWRRAAIGIPPNGRR